jgi:hypothetical protein
MACGHRALILRPHKPNFQELHQTGENLQVA